MQAGRIEVALPDDLCCQPNFETILAWFNEHGVERMIRNVQAIWPDRHEENWRLHCFRDPADAAAFLAHFGGVPFDPKKDRDNGRARGAWRRTDEYRSHRRKAARSRSTRSSCADPATWIMTSERRACARPR